MKIKILFIAFSVFFYINSLTAQISVDTLHEKKDIPTVIMEINNAIDNKENDTESNSLPDEEIRKSINLKYKEQFKLHTPISYISPPLCEMHFKEDPTYYILSADYSPQFFMFSGDKYPFSTGVYFAPQVRILTGNSLPVRTPSLRGGAVFYLKNLLFDKFRIVTNDISRYDYFSFEIQHHSNGQDGCALANYERNESGNCVLSNDINSDKIFNQYNGNFSTTFLELGYNLSFHKSKSDKIPVTGFLLKSGFLAPSEDAYISRIENCYNYFYLGYQANVIGVDPSLHDRYGLKKLVLKYQRTTSELNINKELKNREKNRFVVGLDINISSMDKFEDFQFINRFNLDIKYSWTVKAFKSASTTLVAFSGYKGQDDYNIYLEDHFFYYGAGLAVSNIIYSTKWEDILPALMQ